MITAVQDRPISQPADHNGNGHNGSDRLASVLPPTPREKQADVDTDLLRQHYQALYGRAAGSGGLVCLWRKGSPSIFIEPGDINRLIQCAVFSLNSDLYNVVNLVDREAVDDIQERQGRGSEDDLHSVVAVVADIDAAKPGSGKNYPPQAEIVRALKAMPLLPSIVNLSGKPDGGIHSYWLFDEPIRIVSREDVSRIKAVSRRWQQMLREYLAPFDLDRTYDLARVLRPAGTWNHRHGELVRPVIFRPDRLYDLADFEKHLPEEPPPPATSPRKYFAIGAHDPNNLIERARRYLSKVPGAVAGQDGHGRTFSAACSLVLGFGLSPEDALPIMTEWNQTCVPPWSERELWHKIEDADTQAGERGYLLNGDGDRHGDTGVFNGFKARLLENGRVRFEWVGDDQQQDAASQEATANVPDATGEPCRDIESFRQDMVAARIASLDEPGVYYDGSPTGAGKSYADIVTAKVAGKTLIILRTHKNCEEVAADFEREGLMAAAYPPLNKDTCGNLEQATRAIDAGLSPSASVCLVCPLQGGCAYHMDMRDAEKAANRLATHKRAELTFEHIAEDRRFIAIHEDFTELLAPSATASSGWETVAEAARQAREIARQKNSMTGQHFFYVMEETAHWLRETMKTAEQTSPLPMPTPAGKLFNADSYLWKAFSFMDGRPSGDVVRLCKAVASGDLKELVVRVDKVYTHGKQQETRKSILGVWRTEIPKGAAVWFCDATSDLAEVESLIVAPVMNATPTGRLAQLHKAFQVPLDVKVTTSPGTAMAILRGVLAVFPKAKRVGVICHRRHISSVKGTARKNQEHNLDPVCRQRIAKVEYYRSGQCRGSNEWIHDCDLLVLLGTPRVPPSAIRERLIRTNRAEAASQEASENWEKYIWTGKTESGSECDVECFRYTDPDWNAAYRAVVNAELRQAIGRGRAICENGIDVVVVSNEPLELPIADADVHPVDVHDMEVLQAILSLSREETDKIEAPQLSALFPTGADGTGGAELSASFPNIYIGNSALTAVTLTSSAIAAKIQKKNRRTAQILNNLHSRGLVEKIGLRGGWRLSEAGLQFLCGGSVAKESAEEILQRGEEGKDDATTK